MVNKIPENNLQNLPACACDFIKLVIRKMKYRKKVRAEVQAELAGHFEDCLKECTHKKDRQEKAQQIIDGFGDVKLLAKLIRRAKKRCRPLWKKCLIRTFQALLAFILLFVIYTAWFLSGKPVITTDYVAEMNRIVKPAPDIDPNLNARAFYYKAAELLEELKEKDEHYCDVLRIKLSDASAEDKENIKQWLEDNSRILDLTTEGTKMPYYWPEYHTPADQPNEVISVLMPLLGPFRDIVRALCWRAHLSIEQGEHEVGFSDIVTSYSVGKHLKSGGTLVYQLVGTSIEVLTVRAVRDILTGHRISPEILAEFQAKLERQVADEDFTINFKTEKFFMYDEIQRCFTEDRFGGGHLYLRRITGLADPEHFEKYLTTRALLASFHVLFTHPNKQESREMADSLYDFWDKMANKNPAQIRAKGIEPEKEAMEIVKGNILLEILVPAFGRVIQISYWNKIDVEATLVILAILRYGKDTGGYPENLDELASAGYLKTLPLDPYSDKPLVYKKTDDSFMLYSIGGNFTDDGGKIFRDKKGRVDKLAEEGDWVFWPVRK